VLRLLRRSVLQIPHAVLRHVSPLCDRNISLASSSRHAPQPHLRNDPGFAAPGILKMGLSPWSCTTSASPPLSNPPLPSPFPYLVLYLSLVARTLRLPHIIFTCRLPSYAPDSRQFAVRPFARHVQRRFRAFDLPCSACSRALWQALRSRTRLFSSHREHPRFISSVPCAVSALLLACFAFSRLLIPVIQTDPSCCLSFELADAKDRAKFKTRVAPLMKNCVLN
jgi:hypothetical protein